MFSPCFDISSLFEIVVTVIVNCFIAGSAVRARLSLNLTRTSHSYFFYNYWLIHAALVVDLSVSRPIDTDRRCSRCVVSFITIRNYWQCFSLSCCFVGAIFGVRSSLSSFPLKRVHVVRGRRVKNKTSRLALLSKCHCQIVSFQVRDERARPRR